jgi:D-alanyl-D-alanine carboxypeptidase (penicillin-binding protein 5/6)
MPRLHVRLPAAVRRPRFLVIGAAALVAVVVVILLNQPGGAPNRPTAVAAAKAATSGIATPLVIVDESTPTPVPSGLRVLHTGYAFHDDTARHSGAPDLPVSAGVLLDVDAHRILWEKQAHTPLPPASTSKIFSSLVALANFDPQQEVDVTPDAIFAAADETKLGVLAGDHYTVTELLQAMLTISANDAADVMAVDTVGLTRFVAAMNEQVDALGLHDSHFTSPVGLDDPGQRASAYDLAIAGLAAYDNFPLFRDIVGQTQIDVPATTGHIAYSLHNLDRLLTLYPPAKGIKPGWTGDAGYCFVGLAERNGHRLVLAFLNEPKIYEDARVMFEWGFGQLGIPPLPTPTPKPTPTPTPHR